MDKPMKDFNVEASELLKKYRSGQISRNEYGEKAGAILMEISAGISKSIDATAQKVEVIRGDLNQTFEQMKRDTLELYRRHVVVRSCYDEFLNTKGFADEFDDWAKRWFEEYELEREKTGQQSKPFSYDDTVYRCPLCGNDNVHMQAVEVKAGGITTYINHRLPIITEGVPGGRGTAVRVHLWAECGHAWIRQIFFYKGRTLEELQVSQPEQLTDMWRE